ncbi:MAG TPA: 6-phosphofructokinase [Phycisphaerae bacterium]|nr:6-phosphofructokinase [Phycisphaerae bacterium]
MGEKLKRIGIMTGGGDCPGLNAVIRAVAKPAMRAGLEVMGIEDGYLGLIENRLRKLDFDDVSNILTVGGTILGSCNKANPASFAVPEGERWVKRDVRDDVIANVRQAKLDVIVVIGGDGTMSGAGDLIGRGLKFIGVPKTIDNDLWATDITFGHDTAVTTATEALDKVHTTASSHHRVMVVELMGRYAGWLTLRAGVAAGADVILIPEISFDIDKISAHCLQRSRYGKRFTLIAAGEGATLADGQQFVDHMDETSPDPVRLGGVAKFVADEVTKQSGLESRSMVLGHIQRGGTPTPHDRLLATQFGHHAFKLLTAGQFNEMVIMKDNKLDSVPITEVADKIRTVPLDHPLIEAARSVGASFGD